MNYDKENATVSKIHFTYLATLNVQCNIHIKTTTEVSNE